MAFESAQLTRFETFRDDAGISLKYFFAGIIVDDSLGKRYAEFWLEGAEFVSLPPDDPERYYAIYDYLALKVKEIHEAWVAEEAAKPPIAPVLVRSATEIASYPPITPEMIAQATSGSGS